jgi:hypothetical protein
MQSPEKIKIFCEKWVDGHEMNVFKSEHFNVNSFVTNPSKNVSRY